MFARAAAHSRRKSTKMDDLVWLTGGPIMQKYGEVAEPDEDKFMEKYGKHVWKAQMEVTASISNENVHAHSNKQFLPFRSPFAPLKP
mmetsp:Transcript_69498/g.122676  ORF Transcript_69498/g.122676 Transcript_69498/m.122676 type:complete len:87 (+) Transcript_69498:88-348(+)